MDKIIGIKFALETLRSESVQFYNIEEGSKKLMRKYGIIFLGEKLNCIYSHELCHALKNKFGLDIALFDLNAILPSVCRSLNMSCKPLHENDLLDLVPFEYQINLLGNWLFGFIILI